MEYICSRFSLMELYKLFVCTCCARQLSTTSRSSRISCWRIRWPFFRVELLRRSTTTGCWWSSTTCFRTSQVGGGCVTEMLVKSYHHKKTSLQALLKPEGVYSELRGVSSESQSWRVHLLKSCLISIWGSKFLKRSLPLDS